jgi:hypothetical protein
MSQPARPVLKRYGGSARGARARRHYDLIMRD